MKKSKKSPIRWGILSCASIARRKWVPAIQAVPEAQVVAVASRSLEKANQFAQELNIDRAYGSYDQLINDPDIDAIYIGLPNSMHLEWAIKTLNAGKHLLCDKPLGLTADQASQVVQVAEQQKRVCVESFMYQYHDLYDKIDQWMDQGLIGTLKKVQATFSFRFDRPGDFRYTPDLGGGALLDIGCYCVHVIRKITGQMPDSVRSFSIDHEQGCDWTTIANLQFKEGVIGLVECSFEYHAGQPLSIVGTHGRINCDLPFGSYHDITLSLNTPDDSKTLTYSPTDRYIPCIQEFHQKIVRQQFTPSPAHDAIDNMKVLDAIVQASRTGQEVLLR